MVNNTANAISVTDALLNVVEQKNSWGSISMATKRARFVDPKRILAKMLNPKI
jgi:hypothetical protein